MADAERQTGHNASDNSMQTAIKEQNFRDVEYAQAAFPLAIYCYRDVGAISLRLPCRVEESGSLTFFHTRLSLLSLTHVYLQDRIII